MKHTQEQFIEVCAGNQEAANCLATLIEYSCLLDNIVDEEGDRSQETIAQVSCKLFICLTGNEFWAKNKHTILPLVLQSFRTWVDADIWAKSGDPKKEIAADVLKGFASEIVFWFAFLCGGWEHQRLMSEKHREINWDNRYIEEITR